MVITSNDDALATKAVARLNKLMGKLGTNNSNTNFEVLIPDPTSQHFILGPALNSLNNVPAGVYTSEFPKRKDEDFIVNNQDCNFYEWFHDHHRFWPTSDTDWVSWFERVQEQKGYIWHQAGIYDILQFSKFTIPFNRALVLAALSFWSASTNSFHLGYGPITITLLDLSALVGLKPDGPQFDANSMDDDSFVIGKLNFSSFISEHNNVGGVVTNEEHVAFLLCWLSRYLICNQSFKIVKSNLPLAVALSRGKSYALGPLVLAYLYRGINDLLHSQLRTGGGPLWILQLWLHAFFPKVRPDCFPVSNNLSCEGLKYVFYKEPESSLHDYLMYMCQTDTEANFNFIPYLESDVLPSWLIFPRSEMSETEIATLGDIWASFLVSRDLPVGLGLCGKTGSKTCGVEAYCPNLCARQFGLIQDIPSPPFFSFNTHFHERAMLNSFEELQVLEVMTSHLFKKLQMVPFSLLPSATPSFKGWWGKYYQKTFPHDQDLNYMFEWDGLDQNRPLPPPKLSDGLKKREESTPVETQGRRSDQCQVHRPTKRFKYVDQQEKKSSVPNRKKGNTLPQSECLRGRGRAHSKSRKIVTAYHCLRSMIKGNFISYAQSDEAIFEERSSSVSRDKGTNPPPTNQSHNGRGKGCSKERITKEEVHHLLINPTNSNSQSDCEAKVATSAKNTGPLSRQQQSYALTERYIIDLTEDDGDSELKDLPLTQPVDTSAGKLPCGISSPLTQKAQDSSNESPLPAQSSHINFPTKENGANHSNFHKKCDLKMSKPKTSIRALEFLESYLIQHPDACFSAITEAPVPDSDEISQAKANIQSILALSLDEVMEVDCFQKFKSSLESLLGANSLTGLQGANISNVQGKLDFVESKYRSATEVTAEVNKDFTEKIELEDKVQRYSSQFSEAQKDEQDYLTCINVQESIVEGRRKEVVEAEALLKRLTEDFVEEKAVLKRLKELLTENKARVNKSNYELEQSHQKLHNHCINEKTWVTKALQAKKDLESVAETWAQIQQLIAFGGGVKYLGQEAVVELGASQGHHCSRGA